jgi:tRNA uridine 5-carboxymethylaminomethyl modification enzyme
MEYGYRLGLVDETRYQAFREKCECIEKGKAKLAKTTVSPLSTELLELMERKRSPMPTHGATLIELLRRPELTYNDMKCLSEMPCFATEVEEQIEIQVKYKGYIDKQIAQVKQYEQLEKKLLPLDADYHSIKGLSLEAREKLAEVIPESLGQASRVPGVTPSDIQVLVLYLEQRSRLRGGANE